MNKSSSISREQLGLTLTLDYMGQFQTTPLSNSVGQSFKQTMCFKELMFTWGSVHLAQGIKANKWKRIAEHC